MGKRKRKERASNFKEKLVVTSGKKGSLRLQGNYLGGDMFFSKMQCPLVPECRGIHLAYTFQKMSASRQSALEIHRSISRSLLHLDFGLILSPLLPSPPAHP